MTRLLKLWLMSLALLVLALCAFGFTPSFLASVPQRNIEASSALLPFIDANRLTDWQRHVNVGVPGGIPHRTTIYTNFTGDTNGVTNERVALNAALAACPQGQVVQLAAGTYNVTGGAVNLAGEDFITLRGTTNSQGYPLTRLKGDAYINLGYNLNTNAGNNVTAGATKGSTSITVDSTSDLAVGYVAVLFQRTNGYDFVTDAYTAYPYLTHSVVITSIVSTTVGFRPPLFADFTNVARIDGFGDPVTSNGVENIVFDSDNSGQQPVEFELAVDCWMRNMVFTNRNGKTMMVKRSVGVEIRDSIFTGNTGNSAGHEVVYINQSVGTLVENNISDDAGFPFVMLCERLPDSGAIGNVIAYNYATNQDTGGVFAGDIYLNHGGHTWFNLVEGNVVSAVEADASTSVSHNTIFRNVMYGTNAANTSYQGARALRLGRGSWYHNVVGNIMGHSGMGGVFSPVEKSFGWATNVIMYLGYPGEGYIEISTNATGGILTNPPSTDVGAWDKNVTNTIILHGNYDYVNTAVVNDATRSNTLPASLYLTNTSTAPPHFLTNKTIPIFDAGTPNFARTNLPAVHRWERWKTGALTP